MKNAISSFKDSESKQNEQMQQNFNLFNKFQTYDQFKMRQISALIAENIGFSTASTSSISVLSSLFKTYLEKLCRDAALFSFNINNGHEIDLEDVKRIFHQNSINLDELHDYLCQVGNLSLQEETPLFPTSSSILILPDVAAKPKDQNESAIENIEIVNDLMGKEAAEKERSDNQDQRNNMRVNQKIFPNFSNNYAQELGFIVKKIVPQTLEINIEHNLVKESTQTQSGASFCIIKEDYFSVPVLSLKIEHQIERHKEKKKKKKEKREQDELKDDERKKHYHHKEKEKKNLKETEELDNIEISKDSSKLKIPKIKIRIGPAPSSIQGIYSNLPSASTSKNVHSIVQQIAEIEKDIFIEEQKTSQNSSTKNIKKPEKNEIRPKTPLIIPPLKIIKSPPENEKKSIATLKQQSEEKPKQQLHIKSNKNKMSSEIPNEDDQSLRTVPISSTLPFLPTLVHPTSTQKHCEIKNQSEKISSKKRNRKSDKPTRVDSIAAALFSALESSPPRNLPIQSKALECVLSETNLLPKKSKIPEPKKLSEPPMTVTETKTVKSGRNSAQEFIHLDIAPSKTKMKSKSKIPITPSIPPILIPPVPTISPAGEDEEDVWICPVCSVAYVENGPSMVGCDGCDKWYHWGCVGIFMAPPVNSPWFCSECKKKQKKQQLSGFNGTNSRKSSFGEPPTKKQRRPSK